jgi:hypothetical protein
MGSKARDIFIVGLRNSHAMETQARELMERQSDWLLHRRGKKERQFAGGVKRHVHEAR